jgi:hypothetical protein
MSSLPRSAATERHSDWTVVDQSSVPHTPDRVVSPGPSSPRTDKLPDGGSIASTTRQRGWEFSPASDRKQRVLALPGRAVSAGDVSHALIASRQKESRPSYRWQAPASPQTGSSCRAQALPGECGHRRRRAPRSRRTTRRCAGAGDIVPLPSSPALRCSGGLLVVDSSGERLMTNLRCLIRSFDAGRDPGFGACVFPPRHRTQ